LTGYRGNQRTSGLIDRLGGTARGESEKSFLCRGVL